MYKCGWVSDKMWVYCIKCLAFQFKQSLKNSEDMQLQPCPPLPLLE